MRSTRPLAPGRRHLLVALVATLLTLGLVEGLARLALGPQDLVPNGAMPWLKEDPRLLWALRPELDLRTEGGWTLRTNADGLRDDEVREEKPVGLTRVLSLGDGAAMGNGVEAEQTYAALLEGWLNGPRGPRRRGGAYEVLNAGVEGYGLWQSAEYLATRGLAFGPDVVVVHTLAADLGPIGVSDGSNPLLYQRERDRALIERQRLTAPLLSVAQRSHLLLAARGWWIRTISPPADAGVRATSPEQVRATQEDRLAALGRLRMLCENAGARLIILVPSYPGGLFASDSVLSTFAQQSGLLAVNLSALRARDGVMDGAYFQKGGFYPSIRGHQLIASALAEELERLGL